MNRILLTGSSGTIGKVLDTYLPIEWDITPFDLPEHDVRDYDKLAKMAAGHDAIVHLAWDTITDNYRTDHLNPDNTLQTYNVYKAAVAAGVPQVIMASSVNADRFTERKVHGLLDPYALPLPNSPYGAGKVAMEALGRYYADAKGLEVVCIRFGGVSPDNVPAPPGPDLVRNVWLSHRDCAELVRACLTAETVPGNYAIVYGISNNAGRIHSLDNPFGWKPLDGSSVK